MAWCESPSFSPSTKASLTAIIEAPRIILLQIFATWPLPASPQCTTRLPMRSRIGLPCAKACSEPPTMKVSVAALAPPTPPDTGASSVATPRAAASACALRALATSMVEQSMNSVPCRAAGTMSFHTESTCSPAGSMVMTMSAFSTVDRALATIWTPSRAEASRDAGTTSKPSTCSPDLTRLAAIGAPILPRPMKPMVVMCSPYWSNCSSSAPTERKCRATRSGVTASSLSGRQIGLRSLSTTAARMPSMKSCAATQASAIR